MTEYEFFDNLMTFFQESKDLDAAIQKVINKANDEKARRNSKRKYAEAVKVAIRNYVQRYVSEDLAELIDMDTDEYMRALDETYGALCKYTNLKTDSPEEVEKGAESLLNDIYDKYFHRPEPKAMSAGEGNSAPLPNTRLSWRADDTAPKPSYNDVIADFMKKQGW